MTSPVPDSSCRMDELAQRIISARMGAFAVFLLESLRPLRGSAAICFEAMQPLSKPILSDDKAALLLDILNSDRHYEDFIVKLENGEDSR